MITNLRVVMENLIKKWKELKRRDKDVKISLREWLVNHMIADKLEGYPEKIFFPILIGKDLIQFTNCVLVAKGSGDSYHLVIVNNKYQFFKVGFEPDCDGAYYYGYLVSLTDCLAFIDDYNIIYNCTNQLLKELQNI